MNPVPEAQSTEVIEPTTEVQDGATPPEIDVEAERAHRLSILRGDTPVDDAQDTYEEFDISTGQLGPERVTPPEIPEPEKPAETATDPVADEPVETEDAAAKEKRRIAITRDRLGDRDFAIVQLADHKKISLRAAEKQLFGDTPVPETPAADAPAPQEAGPTVESIDAEIAALIEKRGDARKALDMKALEDISDRLADLKIEKRELQREAQQSVRQQQEAAQQQFSEASRASADKAFGMYPDLLVKGSPLASAVERAVDERLKSDPAFFTHPNAPLILAIEVASEEGIAPSTGKPAAPTTTATPPRKVARPPSSAPGSATGAPAQTSEAALLAKLDAATKSNNWERIKAVNAEIDAFAKTTK